MKKIYIGIYVMMSSLLYACMPVPSSDTKRYQLTSVGRVTAVKSAHHKSILVMQPSSTVGYDTEQMLYVNQPYQIGVFADNSWMSPPATMLFPLMASSLESSHYFYAVASDPNVSKTDYRLESELIRLHQNFLVKPSQIELVMQVILIHGADNRVIATETIYERVPCPTDNPLGGVIAANQATSKLTRRVTHFVIDKIKHDR
ncbi:MAG: hypothetical protein CK424_03175 [Legionella sp.]|nr:MAG: hypothetical protein CK424_03175 [Legionella sp.]